MMLHSPPLTSYHVIRSSGLESWNHIFADTLKVPSPIPGLALKRTWPNRKVTSQIDHKRHWAVGRSRSARLDTYITVPTHIGARHVEDARNDCDRRAI
jgi:hypothetical protein